MKTTHLAIAVSLVVAVTMTGMYAVASAAASAMATTFRVQDNQQIKGTP
jgi:hypothetical protein